MNRARKTIGILEGFKLGSLGISHKPKVDDTPEPSNMGYVITKKVLEDPDLTPRNLRGWINKATWTEKKTGVKGEFFIVTMATDKPPPGAEQNYRISLYGGPDLVVRKRYNSDAEICFRLDLDATDDDEAGKIFGEIYNKILSEGSFGLALMKGKIKKGWISPAGYHPENYLEKTTGITKSSSFELG
jgi:hypothetical protein